MRHEINTKRQEVLVLGAFQYDRASGELTDSEGTSVRMRRQSQDVLSVLAADAGEIVSKTTLYEAVWPGIATTDDSLVQCIADIRRTIGREVVETFPKRGYRLSPGASDEHSGQVKGNRWRLAAFAVCILAAGAALPFLTPLWRPVETSSPIVPPVILPDRTLAVLPFANLSGDPELRYFSNGLSEDLTTELSKVDQLTVISHASSFDFPDAERAFRSIADDLGVRYLVRGTVRHQADRIRINVSLMDPYDGVNLWAERFDRDSRNPFDVQEEITGHIVRALSLTLGVEQDDLQRIEPDAYYMLLRGLEPLRAHTAPGNQEAREYFERALELDPEYARAHANIAITYGRETVFRYSDEISAASIEKGLEAGITAIRLDPDIPDAYFALGVLNLALGEHDNALAAARHSIRLDRNFSDGYALVAEVSVHGGDLHEALAAIRRAKLLHPHYPFSYDWIEGHILFQLDRYGDAQPLLERVADSNRGFYRGLIMLAANYGQQGDLEAASSVLKEAVAIKPGLAWFEEAEQAPYRYEDRRDRLAEGLKAAAFER